MKTILEFNLPEEESEFRKSIDAWKFIAVIQDLDEELRRKLKYESDSLTDSEYAIYENIRKKLYEILNHYEVGIHD